MEELEKKQEHEEFTKERRIVKGSLKEKQTLEWKLNKEEMQKKGNRREKCEISGQNMCGKTEKCLHRKRGTQLLKHQNCYKCTVHEKRSIRQICSYLV